jgi:hypothetical protein
MLVLDRVYDDRLSDAISDELSSTTKGFTAPPIAVELTSDRTLRQLNNPDIGVQRKPSAPRLR